MAKQIIIEIRSGVADVVKKSAGVELIIRDYDINDLMDSLEVDDDGKPYVEENYDYYYTVE